MKRGYSESSSPSIEPPQSRFKHNPEFESTNIKVVDHYINARTNQTLEEGEISPTMEAQPQENPTVQQSLTESPLPPSVEEVEDIIRYKFKNKNLLEEAFTHSSFMCSFSYERLEYVGDAVLSLLFCREHYSLYPDLAPGKLTRLRAANVDTEKLARVALRHGFHRYLRHRKPFLVDQIQEFARAVLEYPLHSNGLIDAPKDLADVVESTIGAVFMDCNSIEIVWQVFKGLLEPVITPETVQIHPNTQLLEICQKKHRSLKYVDTWEKNYSVECLIDGECVGRGTYSLRKEVAVNRAAKDALDKRWKWMQHNNAVIAHQLVTEDQPLLLKNMKTENNDEDDVSSVEAEETIVSSTTEESLETNGTSVRGQNALTEETPCNETNVRGQLEMDALYSFLGSTTGTGDELIGLSRGQRKRLRKKQLTEDFV